METERLLRRRKPLAFRSLVHTIFAANRLKRTDLPSARALLAIQCLTNLSRSLSQSEVLRLAAMIRQKNLPELERCGGVEEVAKSLKTDCEQGLRISAQDIQARKDEFLLITPTKALKGFWMFFSKACSEPLFLLLMASALLSLVAGITSKDGWKDKTFMVFVTVVLALLKAVNDCLRSLQAQTVKESNRSIPVQVIREGRVSSVPISELLLGDVVHIKRGDLIPAEGLLAPGHSLNVDEPSFSTAQGSQSVHVNDESPFLRAGSKVNDGGGLMLVVAAPEKGLLEQAFASSRREEPEENYLPQHLKSLIESFVMIGSSLTLSICTILFILYFTGHRTISSVKQKFTGSHSDPGEIMASTAEIFCFCTSMLAMARPDGLVQVSNLSLAYFTKKMLSDRVALRKPDAFERMTQVTTICCDLPCNLISSEMKVKEAWVAGADMPIAALDDLKVLPVGRILSEGIVHNSSADTMMVCEDDEDVSSTPLENAILSWGKKVALARKHVKSSSQHVKRLISSESDLIGVAVKASDGSNGHCHWKGDANRVLSCCDRWVDKNGRPVQMSTGKRSDAEITIARMASDGMLCVALAYRELDSEEFSRWCSQPAESTGTGDDATAESGEHLVLVAILGIRSPSRSDFIAAVATCKEAGVKVRLVTGESLATAQAIAVECGISQQGEETIEIKGDTFSEYNADQKNEELPKLTVLAKASDAHRKLLIETLKGMRGVVAMVSGHNDKDVDSPEDVRLVFQGVETSKDPHIVLLSDDFHLVPKALLWCHAVYFNLLKLIQFQLTLNISAFVTNFVAALWSGNPPFSATQLLGLNFITDTQGALLLAIDPPTDDVLQTASSDCTNDRVIPVMWRNILGQALYQIATLNSNGRSIFKLKEGPDGEAVKNTIVFNVFVLCQIFNEINARKMRDKNIFKGLFKTSLVAAITLTTSKLLATSTLDGLQWLRCFFIAFLSWPVAWIVKSIHSPEKPIGEWLRSAGCMIVKAIHAPYKPIRECMLTAIHCE